ncbi:TonB-dependent receptor plug domain-containing protein [Blastomonas marina]|uniref:TonB-dependent receptor plug domain-containing protein n=1 Tax=Blastomonas marina TaxID=1867408 RepID=UPI002AC9BD1E|nr:TonB-dependent receptor plug domain-containing protein [Blastomonas marina]WPZ04411.1 TonB-dependent receptor plug domain-containing protein [Blastomonas marina]
MRSLIGLPLIALVCAPTSVIAQDAEGEDAVAAADAEVGDSCAEDINCIVVSAERLLGQVDAAQEPIQTLDEADIAAYGAGSIAELVQQLGPTVSSGGARGGGPPAILLNGVRISGFRELRNFPPEAIERVEVLPEETAVRFGFSPNQRVINFILKDNFTAKTVEIEGGGPFQDGFTRGQLEASALNISGSTRISLALEAEARQRITEADRDLPVADGSEDRLAGDPDPAEFRTLVPESDELSLNGTVAVPIGEGGKDGSLSVNGTLSRSSSRSLAGLDTVTLTDPLGNTQVRTLADPLERRTRNVTAQIGSAFSTNIGDWQLSLTGDGAHTEGFTRIDRRADVGILQAQALAGTLAIDGVLPGLPLAGVDFANSKTNRLDTDATLIGRPLLLPGGDLLVTLKGGFTYNDIRSDDTRSGLGETFLDRTRFSGGVTLGVPITSVDEGFGDFLGDITLDLGASINDLSDFGSLYAWSSSLNWRPIEAVGFTATYQYRQEAPSLTQLGSPLTENFNTPVFDLARNETTLATVIGGGNPDLLRETQRDWKFAFNYNLPFIENGRFQVEYFTNDSDDVTAGFPTLTPEIEAAFPGRVSRDATGRLQELDLRPVTFAERNSESLRFSLNLSGPFGSAFPEGEEPAAQGRRGGPPGGGSQARGGGGGQGGGMFSPERMQQLRDQLCSDDPEEFLARLKAAAESENPPFPPQMLARLKNDAGELDPQRVEFVRRQFCRTGDGESEGTPGAPGGPDRERLAAIRQELCSLSPSDFLERLRAEVARAESGEIAEGDRPAIPSFILDQIKDENGEIDPEKAEQLRQRICAAGPGGEGGQRAEGGGGGGGGQQRSRGGRRGGGGFGGGGDGRGRFFANADYTLRLEDEVLIAPGGPFLDLLDGDSIAGGGSPRHEFRVFGGAFYRGFGSFLSANYTGETRVDGSGLPGSTDLFYGEQFTLNARFFIDFDQRESIVAAVPFLEGSRFSFSVSNIFDSRRSIVDQNGDVPNAFLPDRLDPYGRSFEIDFRKAF